MKMVVGKKKEKELVKIQEDTLILFDDILKQFLILKEAIEKGDRNISLEIIENDAKIDSFEEDIILSIHNFIIANQPMAIDLRVVMGTYSLLNDLERIGDYAVKCAKYIIKYDGLDSQYKADFLNIILIVERQLGLAKNAYKTNDHELSKEIATGDHQIDDMTEKVVKKIIKMIKNEDVDLDTSEINLIVLVKILERSGDHIVNICEQVSYIARGKRYNFEY